MAICLCGDVDVKVVLTDEIRLMRQARLNFSCVASSTNGIAIGPSTATGIARLAVAFTWRRLAMPKQITAESSQIKAGIYVVIDAVIVNSSFDFLSLSTYPRYLISLHQIDHPLHSQPAVLQQIASRR